VRARVEVSISFANDEYAAEWRDFIILHHPSFVVAIVAIVSDVMFFLLSLYLCPE
jgi:hypothetical protein